MSRLFFLGLALLVSCAGSPPPAPSPVLPTPTTDAGLAPAPTPTAKKLAASPPVCPTPAQLVTDLTAASQATSISLSGVSPLNCPEVGMTQTWAGGKLLFSDSPEKPTVRGKLYEDGTLGATSGTDYNRIFAYHVNGKTTGKMKFTVLLKNMGTETGALTLQKKGVAGPTNSYLYAGKVTFQRWLDSVAGTATNVTAGSTVQLDTAFETAAVKDYLMHGIWDYSFDQPHQITICALNETDAPLTVCPTLTVPARDPSHQRGTFPNADKVYDSAAGVVLDTATGIQQFPVAGNTPNDSNAVGTDVTDGSAQTISGNYGVLYKIHLNTSATDGKKLGFLFNPRGGAWGGSVWAVPGITPGGKFLIPPTTTSLGDNTKGAVEGKYLPGSAFTAWVQFMPTGGSAFPLRFVAVPH